MSLVGAAESIYSEECYTLRFRFTEDYPMEAPEVSSFLSIIRELSRIGCVCGRIPRE